MQRELDRIVFEWDSHKIQKARNSISPSGRPIILFEMPELYGAKDYLSKFPIQLADVLEEHCSRNEYACDEDVFHLCEDLVSEHGYRKTSDDPYDAVQLYINLRKKIYEILFAQ